VQTVRGCAKHCSFCSVWRTDGQKPRQRSSDIVMEEAVTLRRLGYRFIALADDSSYPVTLTDLKNAERQGNQEKLSQLKAIRAERFELMGDLHSCSSRSSTAKCTPALASQPIAHGATAPTVGRVGWRSHAASYFAAL
jgi:tRNA A37 methylthiotransferase MiaB